ncbi:MAG: hypothetical protein M1835_004004 [Candelina submexicana]|nr:MAG: hypothetical protein M1835_004004 [Candelina submexicana]
MTQSTLHASITRYCSTGKHNQPLDLFESGRKTCTPCREKNRIGHENDPLSFPDTKKILGETPLSRLRPRRPQRDTLTQTPEDALNSTSSHLTKETISAPQAQRNSSEEAGDGIARSSLVVRLGVADGGVLPSEGGHDQGEVEERGMRVRVRKRKYIIYDGGDEDEEEPTRGSTMHVAESAVQAATPSPTPPSTIAAATPPTNLALSSLELELEQVAYQARVQRLERKIAEANAKTEAKAVEWKRACVEADEHCAAAKAKCAEAKDKCAKRKRICDEGVAIETEGNSLKRRLRQLEDGSV